jgi:hypothetical protein
MDPQTGWLLLPVIILFVIVAFSNKTAMPAPQRIEQWAKKNEVQIVSAEKRWFFTGPFMLRKSAGGAVYRIVVRSPKGEVGEGWLCLNSFFGKDFDEEVKWIRKPAHILIPSLHVTLGPFAKWSLGVLPALVLIVWGFASLASGRLVMPWFLLRKRFDDAVVEGTPALLYAVAMISFGVFAHLHVFWGTNPYQHVSVPARVFGFIGFVCLILGLCFYIIEFIVG